MPEDQIVFDQLSSKISKFNWLSLFKYWMSISISYYWELPCGNSNFDNNLIDCVLTNMCVQSLISRKFACQILGFNSFNYLKICIVDWQIIFGLTLRSLRCQIKMFFNFQRLQIRNQTAREYFYCHIIFYIRLNILSLLSFCCQQIKISLSRWTLCDAREL